MFKKRKAAKTLAQRDKEWKSLVRAITDANSVISESDEIRFQSYLGEPHSAAPSSPTTTRIAPKSHKSPARFAPKRRQSRAHNAKSPR